MDQYRDQMKVIEDHLRKQLGEKVKEKILEKIAKKLGVEGWLNLLTGSFPAAKLASFGTNILWGIWFEGYYIANGSFQWNPYNPANEDQQDQYAEYLIYSWARYEIDKKTNPNIKGGPGYIYYNMK